MKSGTAHAHGERGSASLYRVFFQFPSKRCKEYAYIETIFIATLACILDNVILYIH